MEVNAVVKTHVQEPDSMPGRVTISEINSVKRQFIEDNITLSPEEFAALFGKKTAWALERMRDGSVTVLDEYAKKSAEGVSFSKSARITAESVRKYRVSVEL